MVIKETGADFEKVLSLVEAYCAETGHPLSFNRARARHSMKSMALMNDAEIIYNGGFAFVAYEEDFTNERIGYITKFYVPKELRGTRTARKLVAECLDWFSERGVNLCFASANGKVGRDILFNNLLSKFNFNPSSYEMVRYERNF